ncbi:hypothetical protein BDR03DRAFT_968894, partial [Suillus americanus]
MSECMSTACDWPITMTNVNCIIATFVVCQYCFGLKQVNMKSKRKRLESRGNGKSLD